VADFKPPAQEFGLKSPDGKIGLLGDPPHNEDTGFLAQDGPPMAAGFAWGHAPRCPLPLAPLDHRRDATPNKDAASRTVAPDSTAFTTRSRKSIE